MDESPHATLWEAFFQKHAHYSSLIHSYYSRGTDSVVLGRLLDDLTRFVGLVEEVSTLDLIQK